MGKIINIFVCCAISIVFFANCNNNKQHVNWETFNGESFVIDYPVNWDIDSTGQFDVQAFTCLSPETGNVEETLSFGIILVIDSTELKTAAETFMAKWDFNSSKAKSVEIGNHQSLHVEANTEGVFFKNYFLKKNNTLYYIFYAGQPAAIKKWGDTALKMANSFRVFDMR